ncbi:MAG: hypothetical protein V4496_05750 [Pseudomonadota bacterium]
MKKITALITLSTLLTACASHKPTPPIETYSLPSTTLTQTATLSKQDNVIRMMPATIAPQFSNAAFIYRVSSVQYLTDPYRQFLTAPNIEISSYLENHLAVSPKMMLISSDNLTPANFVLQENITELYADYQNKLAPEAVLSIQFILYHCDNGVMKQVGTTTLSEKTSIKPNDPTSLLAGYQSNLDKMTKKLSQWINLKK